MANAVPPPFVSAGIVAAIFDSSFPVSAEVDLLGVETDDLLRPEHRLPRLEMIRLSHERPHSFGARLEQFFDASIDVSRLLEDRAGGRLDLLRDQANRSGDGEDGPTLEDRLLDLE